MMAASQDLSTQHGQEGHHCCLGLAEGGYIWFKERRVPLRTREGIPVSAGRQECLSQHEALGWMKDPCQSKSQHVAQSGHSGPSEGGEP